MANPTHSANFCGTRVRMSQQKIPGLHRRARQLRPADRRHAAPGAQRGGPDELPSERSKFSRWLASFGLGEAPDPAAASDENIRGSPGADSELESESRHRVWIERCGISDGPIHRVPNGRARLLSNTVLLTSSDHEHGICHIRSSAQSVGQACRMPTDSSPSLPSRRAHGAVVRQCSAGRVRSLSGQLAQSRNELYFSPASR